MDGAADWDGPHFIGGNIALLCQDRLVAYRRDDKPDIPYPRHWDLPGGGREGRESPTACVLREVVEEFAIHIAPDRIIWEQNYPALVAGAPESWFFVAHITEREVESVRFGDEGECWEMMGILDFLKHATAVVPLQNRLRDYLVRSVGR